MRQLLRVGTHQWCVSTVYTFFEHSQYFCIQVSWKSSKEFQEARFHESLQNLFCFFLASWFKCFRQCSLTCCYVYLTFNDTVRNKVFFITKPLFHHRTSQFQNQIVCKSIDTGLQHNQYWKIVEGNQTML